jgi:hypothetical protein
MLAKFFVEQVAAIAKEHGRVIWGGGFQVDPKALCLRARSE